MGKNASEDDRISGARLVKVALAWHIAFRIQTLSPTPEPHTGPEVGIGVGVSIPLALSDGNHEDHGRSARLPDGTRFIGGFDGGGRAYRQNALAAAGVTSGARITADGVTYAWPETAEGRPDTLPVTGSQGTARVFASGYGRRGRRLRQLSCAPAGLIVRRARRTTDLPPDAAVSPRVPGTASRQQEFPGR